jgi:hypothetical protein
MLVSIVLFVTIKLKAIESQNGQDYPNIEYIVDGNS